MAKTSAGVLIYRQRGGQVQVLLVHPGGPLWSKKDLGFWSIPKGEIGQGEDPLAAARREFAEETGFAVDGEFHELQPVRMKSGKIVRAWACAGDFDLSQFKSNTFELEWPPRSGRKQAFPEMDRAAWFPLEEARRRIGPSQLDLLDQLDILLRAR